jgi:phage terminase large subunit-like protein
MKKLDYLFIAYEQALDLKNLGFTEECFRAQYKGENPSKESKLKDLKESDYVNIPTYEQAFTFFREKYGLMHIINAYDFSAEIDYLNDKIVDEKHGDFIPHDHIEDENGNEKTHNTYKEAEISCLLEMIKICKSE